MRKWTEDDIEILKKYYENYGVKYCCILLNRSYSSIIKKAYKLKIKTNFTNGFGVKNWNKRKDDILMKYYVENGVEYCCRLVNRSMTATRIRANRLGLFSKITNGGLQKKLIIKKLTKNKVISLCKHHGETQHYFAQKAIQHCVLCKKIADKKKSETEEGRIYLSKKTKRYRQSPIGKFASRLRTSLRQGYKKYIDSKNINKKPGCFRYFPYSPKDLYDHLENIKQKQKNKCPMCNKQYGKVELTIDHIIPLRTSKTESQIFKLFNLDNLSLLCRSCNSSKGGRILTCAH